MLQTIWSKALIQKFFKEIAAMMPYVDDSPDGNRTDPEQVMKFRSDANLNSFIADHPN